MPSRHRRPASSSQRSFRDLVGAAPVRNGDVPPDLQPYTLTDWRSDQARYNFKANGEPDWARRLHGLGSTVGDGGADSLPYDLVPIHLHPRVVREYKRGPGGNLIPSVTGPGGVATSPGGPGGATGFGGSPMELYIEQIARDTRDIASTVVINRGLIARTVTVPTTALEVVNAKFLRGYIFLNPATSTGLTSAGTILTSAARTTTGQSSSQGVANFLEGHFFLDVTSVPGGGATLDVRLEALDPATLNWAVVQDLFSGITATGTEYAFPGTFGLATDMRVSWEISSGTFTFSVGFVLKNGLAGTSSGVNQTIFIGGPGVTVTNGFPLLEGQKEQFFLRENTQLFAVANSSLPLKIFEL